MNMISNFVTRLISKLMNLFKTKNITPMELRIISREEHQISRTMISEQSLKVLYRLHNAGYQSYLVGGSIRDLLLGIEPKDFDVVTDAKPEEVKKLFRNCRLIGRRFRLAHVIFGRYIIEVATFRGHHNAKVKSKNGHILNDNIYGTIEEDAQRRDFTINALYYSIEDYTIKDYFNGLIDLQHKIIRLIGEPKKRYQEDPVRMLRVIRFATKLDFSIEKNTLAPIKSLNYLLKDISNARLFDESTKLFLSGYSLKNLNYLLEFNIFDILFPKQHEMINNDHPYYLSLLQHVFSKTDMRIQQQKSVTISFLYLALLWYWIEQQSAELTKKDNTLSLYDAMTLATIDVLKKQTQTIMISKKIGFFITEVAQLQVRLTKRQGNKAFKLLSNTKFRAAYDFLLIRAEIEGEDKPELIELSRWWTTFQNAEQKEKSRMVALLTPRKRHNYRNNKKKSEQ